ncbi:MULTISPECIES: ribonuclease HII [unclassified Sphingomonas]|uniref:ribonuclease HII n=1 Tax=unclassified Sphingomonas TaxID=196159 RepID=UPI0006F6CF4D|nr:MULTISPECIES: ribonuclease HII [unclassified Sphingomonas]KQM98912.1 ribonuclease HII [Sphingomonas sp. Leaf25]KQN40509.1 ribonuclease HII [Sphingomonas sp. Leaf42]KQT29863.1 ribonuclease HII [Sphingomonas sp. Leaf407]
MPDFAHEARHAGLVAGVDEAGRGPLAGPVVAAAVILDPADVPEGLDDSKALSAKRRAVLHARLMECAQVGVGVASVEEIDQLNILWASMLAMERAVAALDVVPAMVLVDGNRCPKWRYPSFAIVRGDALSLSIAAASIVAKETRDAMMVAADAEYPGYGWASNKGYGAKVHLAGLRALGVTPLHRRSFAPVAQALLL